MSSHTNLFENIYQYLDKGYDAAQANHQYSAQVLQQLITSRVPENHNNFWNRSISYPRYSTTPSPVRVPSKTIHQELMTKAAYYHTFPPFKVSFELPKPSPHRPVFRNEFADCKFEKENVPRHEVTQYYPQPPARTTLLKHCKFCKKNGEHPDMYLSHQLFNDKELSCPILATFTCTLCQEKGHTR